MTLATGHKKAATRTAHSLSSGGQMKGRFNYSMADAYREYNENEVRGIFEDWISAQGYEIDRRTVKNAGSEIKGRLINRAHKDKPGNTAAEFKLYTDKPQNGWIRDYRNSGDILRWNLLEDYIKDNAAEYIPTYKAHLPTQEDMEKIRDAREAQESADLQAAINEARREYANAPDIPAAGHDYLRRKGIKAYPGMKWTGTDSNALIIPIYSTTDGEGIISYQSIHTDPAKGKRFRSGTRPNEQAGYYTIGEIEGAAQIGIVEGVATAGTVHEAAGIPIVTAFNAGNLPRVYQAIREAYPAAEIFIFADNDAASEAAGNQNAGQIAAQKTGLHDKYIISPPRDFAVIGKDCSDWNDYARENGTDTARKAIRAAMRRTTMNAEQIRTLEYFQNLPAPTLERMTEKAQRRGEGLDLGLMFYNSIGYPEPLRITGFTLIGARTSGGKTSLVTNLTARILQKDPDKKILFLSFEESEDSIFCRILAAYLYNTIGEGDPHISVREVGEAIRDSRAYRGFSQENERKWERIFTAAETIAPRVRIIDLMDRPPIGDVARADICRRLIEEARRDWEQETVICIDYIQKLKAQDSSAQGYRAFKSIMEELQPLIADGALILAAAQFNRTAATANAGDIAGEFWGAYAEQIREAADIEQAAEMIIYCVVDNNAVPDPVMNLRLLKNRRGSRELSAGIPVRFAYGGLHWDEIGQTTLQNPAGYTRTANANGTGKTYSRPTGNAALCDTKKRGSKK